MFSDVYSRHYSIGDMLQASWKILLDHRKKLFDRLLVIFAVILALDIIGSFFPEGLTTVIIQGASSLVLLYGIVAMMLYAKQVIDKNETSNESLLKLARSRYFESLIVCIISGIFLSLLFILLIVPGIIFMIYWEFAFSIVVLTGLTSLKALSKSKEIVKGRWWQTLGYSVVISIVLIVAMVIVGFVSGLFDLIHPVVGTLIMTTGNFIVVIFSSIISAIFYLNFESVRPKQTVEQA